MYVRASTVRGTKKSEKPSGVNREEGRVWVFLQTSRPPLSTIGMLADALSSGVLESYDDT